MAGVFCCVCAFSRSIQRHAIEELDVGLQLWRVAISWSSEMEPTSLDFLADVQGDPRRLSGRDNNAGSLCPGSGCVRLTFVTS